MPHRQRDAERYMDEARYGAAARAYADVLADHPRSEAALLGHASALLGAEQFEDALAAAQQVTDRGLPEGPALHAQALLALGRGAEAEALLQAAGVAVVPDGTALLAEALLLQGRLPDALAQAQAAGDDPLLAWIALRAGENEVARAAAVALVEDPPEAMDARAEAAGVLLALGVASSLDVDEDAVQRWVRAAARYDAAGQVEGTLRALSRAAVARPDDAQYAEHLGLRWLEVGRPALARRALEDALQSDPRREKAWRGLAAACSQLALHDCEATAWEGLVRHIGDSDAAWEGAHAAWLAAGEPARAQALWEEILRRAPTSPLANLRYAQVLRQVGQRDLALGYAERATSLWPTNADAALLLGELHLERGEVGLARVAFERGLRAHPGDPYLQAGLQRALGYGPQ